VEEEKKKMTAAALTPTVVQKTYLYSTAATGTPMRLVKYTVKVTKATEADWIVTGTYCQAGTPILFVGNTIDSSNDGVPETLTYTSSGTKLTLTSSTVGTTYLEVVYSLT